MRSPQECRHEGAAGRDICPQCGAYLAWDVPDPPGGQGTEVHAGAAQGALAVADAPSTGADATRRQAGPDAGAPQPSAAISLRDEEVSEAAIKVQAGSTLTLHARVRNQSEIVDEFDLAVEHLPPAGTWETLPEGWWEIQPPQLYLLPFGVGRSASSWEGEATVKLTPPRSPEAYAGSWPLRIAVRSRARSRSLVAELPLALDVQPFMDVRLTVDPDCSKRRRAGSFELMVENAGNQDIPALPLLGHSHEGDCSFTFEPEALSLGYGERKTAKVRVAAALPLVVGRPIDHRLTLYAQPPGTDAPPPSGRASLRALAAAGGASAGKAKGELKGPPKVTAPPGVSEVAKKLQKAFGLKRPAAPSAQGASASSPATASATVTERDDARKAPSCTCTYRQRALLPWWTGLLLLAAIAAVLLITKPWISPVLVPNVLGHEVSRARTEVKKAGFHGIEITKVPPNWTIPSQNRGHDNIVLAPGDVSRELFQGSSAVGRKIRPGSTLDLITAVRAGPLKVPNLWGLTPTVAKQVLSKAGFAIGDIEPFPVPQGEVIVRQAPSPGRVIREPRHKLVDVTLGHVGIVPSLIGQTPAHAQQVLRAEGLILGTQIGRAPRSGPGAPTPVIATQSVPADSSKLAGTQVNVGLGLPMPKLKGASLTRAAARIKAAGFRVGMVKPRKPAATDVVVKQNPAARVIEPFRTRVTLTLGPPKKKSKKKKGKPAAGAGKPVPSVAGATAASAAAAIAKAGASSRKTYAISAKVPAGRLLSTSPAAGTKVAKGKVVTLVVSAGFPEIAVDDGHRILLLSGVTGKVIKPVVAGPQAATQPSWSPSGADIAYVSGGRIMLTPATGPSGPVAVTHAGATFGLPTFPSTPGAPQVLAAITRPEGRANELCLLSVAHPRPSCLRVPGWSLAGEISWSPHGNELLVGASRFSPSPGTLGLLEFTSRAAFSTRARDWRSHGVVTPAVGGAGVRAAAFSPNGARLALTEDLGGPFSLALVAPSDLMMTKADTFAAPTPACSVQWRADSHAVLVQTASTLGCSAGLGSVYVVDPAHPRALSLMATKVGDAVWQPLPGVG